LPPNGIDFFQSIAGIIDLGCGNGAASIFFASRGASVIALDQSAVAVRNLQDFCEDNGVTWVRATVSSAFSIADYGPADFVFGSMILHHLEPFGEFVPVLARALQPTGRTFFCENNSASSLLVFGSAHTSSANCGYPNMVMPKNFL
jgi:2-polyprenyl-3-methyl-5-hydroxy-6-metoxy-1,4-benzoquinol methylase